MLKLTSKENLEILYSDVRPGDILHSFADISLAKDILGYNPEYSQEMGLRDYFNWYSNQYKIDLKIS
jgi:nucleoside-diphosphate-sugar epimerase